MCRHPCYVAGDRPTWLTLERAPMNTTTANTVRRVQDARDAERVMGIVAALNSMDPKPADLARTAMNAVRAQDPAVLGVLDQMTEAMHTVAENQMGQSIRTHTASDLKRTFEPTEIGLWRASLEAAEKGTPAAELVWYYTAAAVAAGCAPMDDATRYAIRSHLTRNNLV